MLNGGTDMAVRAKSVIPSVFVEVALNPQMSVEHQERAVVLVLQHTGLSFAAQS